MKSQKEKTIKETKNFVDDLCATKYPVFLVHGMMAKDFCFFHSFGKIHSDLKKHGCHVYMSHQDGVGTIKTNAEQLKTEIITILKKEKTDHINIIAHSKGGLDSRYFITQLDSDNIAISLTTLCTPHYGSKTSSKILSMPSFLAAWINFWVNLFYRIFGDKKPNLIKLAEELTIENMATFNNTVISKADVFYQSYSSSLKGKKYDFMASIPYHFTKNIEEDETDGLVSVKSAQFGVYRGNIDETKPTSHFSVVSRFCSRKEKRRISAFYVNLVSELREMGF